jgi:hypothetical protein
LTGEPSVFEREYKTKKVVESQILFNPATGRQVAGRDYHDQDFCQSCWDGGHLVLCDGCPCAYHEDCLSEDQLIPKGIYIFP